MGLSFGWKAADVRESIWKGDDALSGVTAQALAEWAADGDASHLRVFATKGTPTKITFRTLTQDEAQIVMGFNFDTDNNVEAYARSVLLCFRIAVDFDGAPSEFEVASGAKRSRIVKERGVRMLADEFVKDIETRYRGIVSFYGGLVFAASFATGAEKKASSQPSTTTPSEQPTDGPAPGAAA